MKNTNIKPELTIPSEIMSQMKDAFTLESHEGIMLLMDVEMTALEVIQKIEVLENVVVKLYDALLSEYSQDGNCDDCSFCTDFMEDCVAVPEWAKEAVGLEADTKLVIIAEEDSGRIILEPLDYENDISDVSEEMQNQLSSVGICLGELNEGIIIGEVVYGA